MDEAQIAKQVTPEMEQTAAQKARDRARAARWDLDVTIFLFGILAVLIILLFQGIGIRVVVPVATFGLAMVWLVGWMSSCSPPITPYGTKMFRAIYSRLKFLGL